nr:hypothetical protein [Tanacetum cinerariifolium]
MLWKLVMYAMEVSRKGYLEDTAGSKLDETLFQELWLPSRWILWRFIMKRTTGRLVNGSSCGGINMIMKDLDLEPKDIIAKFYGPSWWKELSKETSSKILPCGDRSCRKTFKPIASLIAKGKLK